MKKLLIIPIVLLLTFAACDSVNFDDSIDADEDAVSQSNTQGLMAGAMNSFLTSSGRNYYGKPMLYVQYRSQYVYTQESLYGQVAGGWSTWYNTVLKNLDDIVKINSAETVDPVTLTYGAPVNQIGVAELFSCFVWKRVTDTFGPVPYFEAISDSVTSPAYTPQEQIYKDLVERVKAARELLDPGLPGPTGDVLNGGDVTKWQKFANSFLLSLAIQMSGAYPNAGDYAASVFNEALNHPAGVIDEVSEELWYQYANTSGANNPISSFRRPDYSLSEAFVNAMKGTADGSVVVFSSDTYDDRLVVYSTDASLPGREYGIAQNGSDPAGSEFQAVSLDISSSDSPLHYMTAAYTFLNRAEAAALGWTSEDAAAMLENAILISFETLDSHYVGDGSLTSKGIAFATARLADAAAAPGGILQVIREEKWVSLFPRPFQPWSEWRRTGTPWLLPAPDAVNGGTIPNRYLYPGNEAGVNRTNYEAGVALLQPGEDSNTSTFWWDVN